MYCVIDFETTGLDANKCDVIEYAAVRVEEDGEGGLAISEIIDDLCAPKKSYISQKITQITGITPDMVAGKPPFEECLQSLLDFIGDDTIVAHNIGFDMGFLRRYCNEAGLPVPVKTQCTIRLARGCCPPPYRLEAVAKALSVDDGGYHRARADAYTTARVFIALEDML
jgi:DNA polymerase III epsilon subunit family exonuclease